MEQEKIIAGFRVLQNLQMGSGSQGTVYKAVCEEPREGIAAKGDVVALKVMFVQDEGQVQWKKLQKRTQELSRLDHPNVVRYRGCFNVSGPFTDMHVVVQEFLEGETLKDRLARCPNGLDVDEALRIVRAAIDGLVYTSGCGIVHRDIKPGNIFLGIRDGKIESVKLIDFEIARQEGGTVTTAAGNIRGSFDYMAPDFIDATFHGDVQSDIFSMGVVLHEVLTGKTPYQRFEGDNKQANFAFLSRWAQQQPDGNSPIHVSSRIRRLLAHADEVLVKSLSPDRSARYADFAAFREAIKGIRYRDLRNGESTYRLLQFIGKGGFGEVFKARERQSGMPVAIKHLLKPEYAERFFREAKIMQKLNDPCFVRFVDFFVSGKNNGRDAFLVMAFLDGMPGNSLRDAIKGAAGTEAAILPQMDVLYAFHRYAHGLQVMHSQGIYHRDIKPSNLYYPEGHPDCAAIMDLGIARDVHGTVTQGQVPGTLDYMPPEVVVSDSRGDSGMDIYALGLCLYEALSGKMGYPRLPPGTEGLTAFFARARSGASPNFEAPVVANDAEMLKLLQDMTAPDVGRRIKSAAEVVERLDAIIRKRGGKGDLTASLPEEPLTETIVFDLSEEGGTVATTPMNEEAFGALAKEVEKKDRRSGAGWMIAMAASLALILAGACAYVYWPQIRAELNVRGILSGNPQAQPNEPLSPPATNVPATADGAKEAITPSARPAAAADKESEEARRLRDEIRKLEEKKRQLDEEARKAAKIKKEEEAAAEKARMAAAEAAARKKAEDEAAEKARKAAEEAAARKKAEDEAAEKARKEAEDARRKIEIERLASISNEAQRIQIQKRLAEEQKRQEEEQKRVEQERLEKERAEREKKLEEERLERERIARERKEREDRERAWRAQARVDATNRFWNLVLPVEPVATRKRRLLDAEGIYRIAVASNLLEVAESGRMMDEFVARRVWIAGKISNGCSDAVVVNGRSIAAGTAELFVFTNGMPLRWEVVRKGFDALPLPRQFEGQEVALSDRNFVKSAVSVTIPELSDGIACLVDGEERTGVLKLRPGDKVSFAYRRRGHIYRGPVSYDVTDAAEQKLPSPSAGDWEVEPVQVWVPRLMAGVSCWIAGQEMKGGSVITNVPGQSIACLYRRKGYKDVQKTHEVVFAEYQELPAPTFGEWELLSVTVSLPRLPEGTTCLIDGKLASDNLTRKPGERISAIYRRDGYEDVHKTYEVAFEDGQRLPGPAEGEWKLLKVKVAVPPLPSGVICKVDDVAISGRETLLSPGQHVCEYVRPDYQSQKVDFQVGEDGQAAVPPPSEWTATEGLKSLDAAEIAAKKSDWKEVERLLRMADVQGEANVARRAGFQRQIQLQVDLSKLTEQAVLYYEDESWAQVLRCLADAHRQGYSLSADDRAMVDDSYQKGRNRIATIRKRVMAALAIGKTPPYDLAKLDEEEKQLHAWYAEIAK